MLNKELLMLETELPPVHVTLEFYGGRNSGTDYTWTSPDGTVKTGGVFDERIDVVETLTCKPNTIVSIRTDNYSGDYTATPPQDITVDTTSSTYLIFTAFRDVTVVF
jgi:hypothetical protein|nr:MAG TPA: hypothetical protein [Caudoviricetes sp.]